MSVGRILPLTDVDIGSSDPDLPAILASNATSGLAIRVQWNSIETAPQSYDWTLIDELLNGMPQGWNATLRVGAGRHTPQWYKDEPEVILVDYFEPTGGGSVETFPVPWGGVSFFSKYLDSWDSFLQALGQKYTNNQRLTWVMVTGASRSTEMFLPVKEADNSTNIAWEDYGYSPAVMVDTYRTIYTSLTTHLPTKTFPLAVSTIYASQGLDGAVQDVANMIGTEFPAKGAAGIASFIEPIVPGDRPVWDAYLMLDALTATVPVIEPNDPGQLTDDALNWLDWQGVNLQAYVPQLNQFEGPESRQRFLEIETLATSDQLDELVSVAVSATPLHRHSSTNEWIDFPSLMNGWIVDVSDPPQYMVDAYGFVRFRGAVGGAARTGPQIATLPAEFGSYLSTSFFIVSVLDVFGGNDFVDGVISIDTLGTVIYSAEGAFPTLIAPDTVFLNGISYWPVGP